MEQDRSDDEVAVKLPSGTIQYIYTDEVAHFESLVKRYMDENHWSNITDLLDVDRLLIMELMCLRWGNWIFRERDYWGEPVDVHLLQKSYKEHSGEIRLLKKQLGIDKESRTKEQGLDSFPSYLANLKRRAKEFGIHRDNMVAKAIELMQEIIARTTLWDNCTPEERKEENCTGDDILEWLRDDVKPKFEEVDKHFRENNQKYWRRDL